MPSQDIQRVIASMAALQPSWEFDTSNGTYDSELSEIFFFKQTSDGVVHCVIKAFHGTRGMLPSAGITVRLYPQATLKDVERDYPGPHNDFTRCSPGVRTVYGRPEPVTIFERYYDGRRLPFGLRTAPADLWYLCEYVGQIGGPMLAAARQKIQQTRVDQQRQKEELESSYRSKYLK